MRFSFPAARNSAAGWHMPSRMGCACKASDHLVSEAIYLADPEGNGIEIYRDRPRDEWTYQEDGTVAMNTLPLDLQALYDEAPKGA